MAEWLSTDFFKAAETATSRIANHSNAHLCEVQSAFTERTNEIRETAENQQHAEAESENQFRSEEFADEVELENEDHCNGGNHAPAHFRLFSDRSSECFHVPEMRFH
jgi:hypothetical protein